ncbi:hypothetical protein Pint_35922 [Pistacia integerrima]|uniref:Uncharacterized protein n=1 Tax=Pistacia integerrima TaxID=434235 RepID=A0ACC0Y0R7_9ROSI|nr:hypothetical protein Pint_35922 [Pistacia integerrima]
MIRIGKDKRRKQTHQIISNNSLTLKFIFLFLSLENSNRVYTSCISFPCVPSVYKSAQSRCCFNGDRRSSRKILAGKPSKDYDASSLTIATSDKVLIPCSKGDRTSSFTDQLETPDTVSIEQEHKLVVINKRLHFDSSFPLQEKVSTEENEAKTEVRPGSIPPLGRGYGQYKKMREDIDRYEGGLELFSRGYEKLGFTHSLFFVLYNNCLLFQSAALIGDFNNWNPNADIMTRVCFLCFCKSDF